MTVANDGNLVLVAGATGGVGQLVVGKLLEQNFRVRVLTRNAQTAAKMFDGKVDIAVGDIHEPSTLAIAVEDITHIICCTGTTAFPSTRWQFYPEPNLVDWVKIILDANYRESRAKNTPLKVDAEGVSNLVAIAPRNLQRFVFVSSIGILRKHQPPFNILNGFGVLDAKQQGETAIINSGLPYTIIRPGRLIDGPYTSYDLNTLLKATTGGKLDVVIGQGDTLAGDASRIDVATACVEAILYPGSAGKVLELVNRGNRPPVIDWEKLLTQ